MAGGLLTMKKFLLLLLFVVPAIVLAQTALPNTSVMNGSGAPVGACVSGSSYTDSSTGNLWNCTNLMWVPLTAGAYNVNLGRQTIITASGTSATFQIIGDVATVTGSTTFGTPTATFGPAVGLFSAGTGTVSGVIGNVNYRVGRNIRATIFAGPAGKITDERWWWGFTNQSLATQGGSDNPAGNYAAFRFSTNAGDTAWQAITKDGTTQNVLPTGIVPVINQTQIFTIVFNDSVPNVQFFINGVLVATSSAHLPTSGTNLAYVLTNNCFVSTTSNGELVEQVYVTQDY